MSNKKHIIIGTVIFLISRTVFSADHAEGNLISTRHGATLETVRDTDINKKILQLSCIEKVEPDRILNPGEEEILFQPSKISRVITFKAGLVDECYQMVTETFPGSMVTIPQPDSRSVRLMFGSSVLNHQLKSIYDYKDPGMGVSYIPTTEPRTTHFITVKDQKNTSKCAKQLQKSGIKVNETLEAGIIYVRLLHSQVPLLSKYSCILGMDRNRDDYPILPDLKEKLSQTQREAFESNFRSSSQWALKAKQPNVAVYELNSKKDFAHLQNKVQKLSPTAEIVAMDTIKTQDGIKHVAVVTAPWEDHLFKLIELESIKKIESVSPYYSSRITNPKVRVTRSFLEKIDKANESEKIAALFSAVTVQLYREMLKKLKSTPHVVIELEQENLAANFGLVVVSGNKSEIHKLTNTIVEALEISDASELLSPPR